MIVLDELNCRENLFPFSETRHVAEIMVGALTIQEKWQLLTVETISLNENDIGIKIPANLIPTIDNFNSILNAYGNGKSVEQSHDMRFIQHPWELFQNNDFAIRHDIALLTNKKILSPFNETNTLVNKDAVFIEESANVNYSVLNATDGPIFISAGATVMEGCLIRGPFFLGKSSTVKMGAKIYGATSVGQMCTVAGEIKNSIISNYSNKAHDGYLGDSVLGEWCNLGAGTNNSNVKNNASTIAYKSHFMGAASIAAGNKAGLIMGDYSRAAINTSFNTGTMVGVCCNIFNESMPPKFINNFTWGNETYQLEKAIKDINNWMAFKHTQLKDTQIETLKKLHEKI